MTRVLYVEANEDGTVGGSHKLLFDLVTRLSPEFEPVVLFYEDNIWAERLADEGVETITWDAVRASERPGLTTGGKLSTAVTLARAVARRRNLIRDREIDLVHLNNSPYVGFDDWLPASRLSKVPCMVSAMGKPAAARNRVARALICSFDAFFPLSRHIEGAITVDGVDPARVTLSYPGVDLARIDAMIYRPASEIRAEFGLADDQLLVSMIGNIRHWKGQHVVLSALGGLSREERARLKVLFVGQLSDEDEAYQERLDTLVRDHGLEDVVEFTGRREDVPDLLEASDIAIHASVEPEPFGLVVQEAMIHGCATIAADAGGPVEMITEDSGFMFDAREPAQLAAHLGALIRDDDLRCGVSARARVRARAFDVRDYVTRIEDRYRTLLSGR